VAFLARFNDKNARGEALPDPKSEPKQPIRTDVRTIPLQDVVHAEEFRHDVKPAAPAPGSVVGAGAGSIAPPAPPKRIPVEPTAKPAAPSIQVEPPRPAVSPAPFEYHAEPTMFGGAAPPPRRVSKRMAIAAALLIAVLGGGYVAGRQLFSGTPAEAVETGSLTITTNPPGAQVFVDGEARGLSPVTLTLAAGSHKVELRGQGEPRTMPVTINPGTEVSQYIELPAVAVAASTGQLQIRTEPAGARVTVDGAARGTSPMVVADLTPGEHIVQLDSGLGSVRQTVMIESGVTASLVVPLGAAAAGAPVSGWITVTAPINVQIFEGGQLLGSSLIDRIMVSAGRHDVEVVNEALGFRVSRSVQVAPGKVSQIAVEVPNGMLALNAIPWAEVWIDGEKAGETPLGNISIPIGSHSVVFRHPELGEQHHTAVVTLNSPTRLSVDLRKQ
jgi:hypothetical protein